jgi:hypothetical protein
LEFIQLLTFNQVFGSIHDIELTGGIETSIRGAREQLTIARKNVNANTNYWSLAGVNEVGNVLSYRDEVLTKRNWLRTSVVSI